MASSLIVDTCSKPSIRSDCCRRFAARGGGAPEPWADAHGYLLTPLRGCLRNLSSAARPPRRLGAVCEIVHEGHEETPREIAPPWRTSGAETLGVVMIHEGQEGALKQKTPREIAPPWRTSGAETLGVVIDPRRTRRGAKAKSAERNCASSADKTTKTLGVPSCPSWIVLKRHFLFCINPRIHPIASGSAVKIPADRSPTAHRDVTIRPPRSVLPYQAPNKKSPWDSPQPP